MCVRPLKRGVRVLCNIHNMHLAFRCRCVLCTRIAPSKPKAQPWHRPTISYIFEISSRMVGSLLRFGRLGASQTPRRPCVCPLHVLSCRRACANGGRNGGHAKWELDPQIPASVGSFGVLGGLEHTNLCALKRRATYLNYKPLRHRAGTSRKGEGQGENGLA